MRNSAKAFETLGLAVLLTLAASGAYGQKRTEPAPTAGAASETFSQARLKLSDGSSVDVDEAWESAQGIWYRRGGMSHLIAKDRVKRIERVSTAKPKTGSPSAKVMVTADSEDDESSQSAPPAGDQPVWIYLVGGARFEADYFLRMNNTGGPVDVWQIDGIEVEELLDAGSGYLYLPRPVHSSLVRLTALDGQQPVRDEQTPVGPSDAYSSDLAFTFDQEPREPDE